VLRKQLLIALGMAAAVAVILTVVFAVLRDASTSAAVTADEALRLAIRWLIVPGLCLLAGVGLTANRRFFLREAIDGNRAPGDRSLEINLRYNQNTLEQVVLAAIAWSGLALAAPASAAALLPALAGLFAVGRVTFWLGYLYAPWARAFGLGLTFYPTVATLLWLGAQLVG
jgi:hypothetical protein